MTGMTTLAELYLGAEPTGVTTDNDHLLLHLSNGRSLALPFEFVSQLALSAQQTIGARLLILSQPPRIADVQVTKDALIVTLQDNRCVSCHGPDNYKVAGAPKVANSHLKERDGNMLPEVSPALYQCTACHVPQVDAKPLVQNTFRGAVEAKKKK